MQRPDVQLDQVLSSDTLKCRLEHKFLMGDDNEVADVIQKVAALSAVECADLISQLLTYFEAFVTQIKAKVRCVGEIM